MFLSSFAFSDLVNPLSLSASLESVKICKFFGLITCNYLNFISTVMDCVIFAFDLFLISLSLICAVTEAQGGGGAAMELWCVAKNNVDDATLQSALDWACGAGGADCGPIQNGGPCYVATDLQRTASYAFNDYFIKHGQSDDSCSFGNAAALTSLNPSHSNCKFPSSLSAGNGNFSGSAAGSGGAYLSSGSSIFHRRNWGSLANYLLFAMAILL